jgi:hypothetical protein
VSDRQRVKRIEGEETKERERDKKRYTAGLDNDKVVEKLLVVHEPLALVLSSFAFNEQSIPAEGDQRTHIHTWKEPTIKKNEQ